MVVGVGIEGRGSTGASIIKLCLSSLHGRMGTLRLRGAEGLICPKLYTYFFLLALPRFSSLFCPNLGGQLPPCLVRLCLPIVNSYDNKIYYIYEAITCPPIVVFSDWTQEKEAKGAIIVPPQL